MSNLDNRITTLEDLAKFSVLKPTGSLDDITPSDDDILGRGFIHVGTAGKLVLEVENSNGEFSELIITNFIGGFLDRFVIRKIKAATTALEIDFYNIF